MLDSSRSVPASTTRLAPLRFKQLEGGRFRMGSDEGLLPLDGEGPARLVTVAPFAVDPFAVTNEWFAQFVRETGYVTDAERLGWSYVFFGFLGDRQGAFAPPPRTAWWRNVPGACWHAPEGSGSQVDERGDHPVVHASWNDATAFAAWAGGRLPAEAEWEFASRGGLEGKRFPWGDEEPSDANVDRCNIWQGSFPTHNTVADGFAGTAPVGCFPPNGFGVFNTVGNVWEWCADAFQVRSLKKEARKRNEAARLERRKLLKGGSYLCHRSYCYRYRNAARTSNTPDTSCGHIGFRIVFDLPKKAPHP